MNNVFYHIYCKNILGVKTNVSDFRWVYGSAAPCGSFDEYERCIVKIDLCVKPEKKLNLAVDGDGRFQAYTWNERTKTLSCRRSLFRFFKIGFNIRIVGNTVHAEIGQHYYKFVRGRIMNLHGIYYLLSDLANMLLLKNGFLSLYASGVFFSATNKGVVCFAPPNTGKTLSVTNLCSEQTCNLIGEDIVVVNRGQVHSCPWTASYRKNKPSIDSAGSFRRVGKVQINNVCDECKVTNLAVLSLEKERIIYDKEELLRRILILNGYLFNYYSSPVIKILGYFDTSFDIAWNERAKNILERLVSMCEGQIICSPNPLRFGSLIHEIVGRNA